MAPYQCFNTKLIVLKTNKKALGSFQSIDLNLISNPKISHIPHNTSIPMQRSSIISFIGKRE